MALPPGNGGSKEKTRTNDAERLFSQVCQWRVFGRVDVHNSHWHDCRRRRTRTMEKHPNLSPATGTGKRLKLRTVHAGITSSRDNPGF